MNNELCFIINNEKLYFDINLIEFQDIPMFFICKSDNKYYVVLCIDYEKVEYIIIEASPNSILKMLYAEIEMRELYNRVSKYWTVISEDSPENDKVEERSIECLDPSILPLEGAKYEVFENSILEYRSKLEESIFNSSKFSCITMKGTAVLSEDYDSIEFLGIEYFANNLKTYKKMLKKSSPPIQLDIQTKINKNIFASNFIQKTNSIKNEISTAEYTYCSTINNSNSAA